MRSFLSRLRASASMSFDAFQIGLKKLSNVSRVPVARLVAYARTMDYVFGPVAAFAITGAAAMAAERSTLLHLRFEHVLNCMRLFLRHDLRQTLRGAADAEDHRSVDTVALKAMSLYAPSQTSVALERGLLDWQLVRGLCFGASQLDSEQIEEAASLLEQLGLLYKSQTPANFGKCVYFRS